jgi:Flp pilus assembly protein TadD
LIIVAQRARKGVPVKTYLIYQINPDRQSSRGSSAARPLLRDRTMSRRSHAIEHYFQQASRLHLNGKYAQAAHIYREILAVAPKHADSLHMLGILALQAGQTQTALQQFDAAIGLRPRVAIYHVNRANALHRLGRFADAANACDAAIRLDRTCAEAYQVLGHIQYDLQQAEAAVAAYRAAARLRPSLHDIHNNLAIALRGAGRLEEAEASLREALRREPREPQLNLNLSGVLKELGRFADAEACVRDLLRADPTNPLHRYNLGLLLLLLGQFEEGWDCYQVRSQTPALSFPTFRQPRWQGEPLAGRTLLVHPEQGLGDAIQFCRYLPLLPERAGTGPIIFQVERRMLALLTTLGGDHTIVAAGEQLPPLDLVCPLMSLPGLLGTTVETVPATVPYLAADPARVAAWRHRLGNQGYKVGIAWQGNPASQAELGRSIPLREFCPLTKVPGVRLISLQKYAGSEQLTRLPPDCPAEELGDSFDSGSDAFLDAAAVMAGLDLVIASDSAIAHLAGALGRPVWVVLQHVPDWRWMIGRTDCPWYPSMRLYRQARRGDWAEVFARVADDLTALVRGQTAGSA